MLDLLIKGATVVDGTGAPRYAGDVGVRDGRIAVLAPAGTVTEPATRVLDATGLVVAPGFIDIHTHYDAQLFWDPALTPSSLHGVTTAIGGNCGFTIAPIGDEHADYLMRMLARVEGMPLESLAQGVPWGQWRTVSEWFDRIEGTMAINTGFLAGHSAIRRVVLGDDVHDPKPTEQQLEAMEAELRAALGAGALGFSSSNGIVHYDGDNEPVPSRAADDDEVIRLSRVVSEFPGATALEYIPTGAADEVERMIGMSLAANRPLNWNLLVVTSARRGLVEHELSASDTAAAAGARIIALTNPGPTQSRRTFFTGFVLDAIPDWRPILDHPIDERIELLKRPDVRATMLAGMAKAEQRLAEIADLPHYVIEDTATAETAWARGRMVQDIAAELGVEPLDALLDIVVADGLRTTLLQPETGGDDASWKFRSQLWSDPRVVVGASDAGAHLDTLSTFFYTTDLLGPSVRDAQRITMEEAVRLITDVPARLYGLRHRGRIAEGWFADLVVFDPDTVGHGHVHTRDDLPGGASRLFATATGISHVFVNGTEILHEGVSTGAIPGTLLRGGRDTEPVTL